MENISSQATWRCNHPQMDTWEMSVLSKDVGFSLISGWWFTYPSEKYESVSWDDDIPNMMGKS